MVQDMETEIAIHEEDAGILLLQVCIVQANFHLVAITKTSGVHLAVTEVAMDPTVEAHLAVQAMQGTMVRPPYPMENIMNISPLFSEADNAEVDVADNVVATVGVCVAADLAASVTSTWLQRGSRRGSQHGSRCGSQRGG